ncbi:hypothetical protein MJ547_04185, partial [Burkholderia gladioli]
MSTTTASSLSPITVIARPAGLHIDHARSIVRVPLEVTLGDGARFNLDYNVHARNPMPTFNEVFGTSAEPLMQHVFSQGFKHFGGFFFSLFEKVQAVGDSEIDRFRAQAA